MFERVAVALGELPENLALIGRKEVRYGRLEVGSLHWKVFFGSCGDVSVRHA